MEEVRFEVRMSRIESIDPPRFDLNQLRTPVYGLLRGFLLRQGIIKGVVCRQWNPTKTLLALSPKGLLAFSIFSRIFFRRPFGGFAKDGH
jgi:hypothetical protein